jgi:hypothetical protein
MRRDASTSRLYDRRVRKVITLAEALIFALALSVLSSPRPDAPPLALFATR